jgi:NAD(P)-dependent dehydrogenase (short-subunit alcohol dehydrogenase family)
MNIAMITGANSGIGFETARTLAARDFRIVMVCRNRAKAEDAKSKIIQHTDNHQIDILIGDLALQKDIFGISEAFYERYEKLDVLVNNAGIIPGKREETPQGIEKSLAVNHLAPFLLTNLLQKALLQAEKGRIITVASEAHRAGTYDPDNLQLSEGYNSFKAYANSKLFNIMFTAGLADRLSDTSVTAYSLHPGTVRTNIHSGSSQHSIFSFLLQLAKPFLRSPKKGAMTSVYLARNPGIETLSGKYFIGKKVVSPLKVAANKEKCMNLWEISETLTMKWDKNTLNKQ